MHAWNMEGFYISLAPPFQALDGLNAMQLTRFIKAQVNVENLSRIVQEAATLEVFNYIHASTAITRAGHFLKEEKSSLMTTSVASTRQFSAIVQVARPFIGTMDARGLTTFIWALGCSGSTGSRLAIGDKEVFEELLDAARLNLENFSAQALTNTAWSLAVMEYDDPVFMTQIVAAAKPKLREFNQQDLSSMVYALAKRKQRGAADPQGLDMFMNELVQSTTEQLDGFNPQQLSNTAWSLVIMGHDDPVLMAQIIVASRPKLHTFTPLDICNIAYALAQHKQRGSPNPTGLDVFLSELVQLATEQLGGFKPKDLSSTILSLTAMGYRDLNFQRRVRVALESRMQTLSLRDRAIVEFMARQAGMILSSASH